MHTFLFVLNHYNRQIILKTHYSFTQQQIEIESNTSHKKKNYNKMLNKWFPVTIHLESSEIREMTTAFGTWADPVDLLPAGGTSALGTPKEGTTNMGVRKLKS